MSEFATHKCLGCGAEFDVVTETPEVCENQQSFAEADCALKAQNSLEVRAEPYSDDPEHISLESLFAETVWTSDALCRGKTDIFFAPPGERSGKRRRREAVAMAYCSQCPVSDPCKEAGRGGREHGFWGGENDESRSDAGYAPSHFRRRNSKETPVSSDAVETTELTSRDFS